MLESIFSPPYSCLLIEDLSGSEVCVKTNWKDRLGTASCTRHNSLSAVCQKLSIACLRFPRAGLPAALRWGSQIAAGWCNGPWYLEGLHCHGWGKNMTKNYYLASIDSNPQLNHHLVCLWAEGIGRERIKRIISTLPKTIQAVMLRCFYLYSWHCSGSG